MKKTLSPSIFKGDGGIALKPLSRHVRGKSRPLDFWQRHDRRRRMRAASRRRNRR